MVMINQIFLIQFVTVLLYTEFFTMSSVKAKRTTLEAKTSTFEVTLPVEDRPTETEAMAGTSQTMGIVFL